MLGNTVFYDSFTQLIHSSCTACPLKGHSGVEPVPARQEVDSTVDMSCICNLHVCGLWEEAEAAGEQPTQAWMKNMQTIIYHVTGSTHYFF